MSDDDFVRRLRAMRDVIITSEADIAKVPNASDRRELRNFARFLRLWPHHGFDMLARPRWQKYLGINESEAEMLQKNPPFRGGHPTGDDRAS